MNQSCNLWNVSSRAGTPTDPPERAPELGLAAVAAGQPLLQAAPGAPWQNERSLEALIITHEYQADPCLASRR